MRDQARSVERDGRYNGSEVLFALPYAADLGMAGSPVYGVVDFKRDNGIFTLSGNWSQASGVPAGVDYAMVNLGGRGYPVEALLYALELAFDALNLRLPCRDDATVLVPGLYQYPIPDTFSSVTKFAILRNWSGHQYIVPLLVGGATGIIVQPESRTVLLNVAVTEGDLLSITGERRLALPPSWDDADAVPLRRVEEVVNAAIEYVTRTGNTAQQGIAASQYSDRVRSVPLYRQPNAIPLP
jgi:hypothetical protein